MLCSLNHPVCAEVHNDQETDAVNVILGILQLMDQVICEYWKGMLLERKDNYIFDVHVHVFK